MEDKSLYEKPEMQVIEWTKKNIATISNRGEGSGEEVDIW